MDPGAAHQPLIAAWPATGACNTFEVKVVNSNPVLAVHDLARSAVWYRDVLGCAVAAGAERT